MRPIHGLIALAAVALLLIGGLLIWTSSEPDAGLAPDLTQRDAAASKSNPGSVELAGVPDASTDRSESARSVGVAPGRPESPATEGREQRVSGRVLDESGKPVANALVYAAAGGGFDDLALDEIDPAEMPWFRRADARTDSAGRFALAPRIHARVRLAVRAPGFAPLDLERTIAETNPEVGDLVVQRGVVLEGRVIDHLGRPVVGAELRRRRAGSGPMAFFGGRGGAVVAKSGADGSFRADSIALGPWSLRITSDVAPDKDESGETVRVGEVVSGITIQLEEGFEIAGVVTGVPPTDVSELRVVAVPRGDGGGDFMPSMGLGQRTARLAADGSFVVRGCKKESKYRLSARVATEGFGGMLRSPTRSATVDATSGERGLVIAYRAETALTFRVVDAESGAPVTTMTVSAGSRWAVPLTDEKNRTIREFPGGQVRYGGLRIGGGGGGPGNRGGASNGITLRVEAAGFAPYERTDVQVTEGQDNDLGVIRLERTSIVKVHVTAAGTGAPVQGARVSLEEVKDDSSGAAGFSFRATMGDDDEALDFGGGSAHRGTTDADGNVSVSSIPGSSARIVVKHRDFSELRTEPIDLPRGTDIQREVTISAGGTIVVLVVDPAGNPVRNEALEHRSPGDDDTAMFFGPDGPLATDAEGRTTLRHQSTGLHMFRLQGGGGPRMFGGGGARMMVNRSSIGGEAPPEAPWTEITVQEGGEHEVKLIAPERARVIGRVREGGRPLAGATVRLKGKDGGDMPFFDEGPKAETDGTGEFALENVSVGEYVLSVTHPSRAMASDTDVRVASGETRENVELPLSILEGRVTDEEGKGIAGLRVQAERRSGGDGITRQFMFAVDSGDGPVSFGGAAGGGAVTTNADGRYTLRGVLADTDLTVVATGKGVQRTTSEAVRVAADATRTGVDLVAKMGASLEVTCKRPDGTPATPCEVRAVLQAEGDADTKLEITRGDGKARFQGLKPGRWRITARDLGTGPNERERAPTEQTIELSTGDTNQVTLEVRGS